MYSHCNVKIQNNIKKCLKHQIISLSSVKHFGAQVSAQRGKWGGISPPSANTITSEQGYYQEWNITLYIYLSILILLTSPSDDATQQYILFWLKVRKGPCTRGDKRCPALEVCKGGLLQLHPGSHSYSSGDTLRSLCLSIILLHVCKCINFVLTNYRQRKILNLAWAPEMFPQTVAASTWSLIVVILSCKWQFFHQSLSLTFIYNHNTAPSCQRSDMSQSKVHWVKAVQTQCCHSSWHIAASYWCWFAGHLWPSGRI